MITSRAFNLAYSTNTRYEHLFDLFPSQRNPKYEFNQLEKHWIKKITSVRNNRNKSNRM